MIMTGLRVVAVNEVIWRKHRGRICDAATRNAEGDLRHGIQISTSLEPS